MVNGVTAEMSGVIWPTFKKVLNSAIWNKKIRRFSRSEVCFRQHSWNFFYSFFCLPAHFPVWGARGWAIHVPPGGGGWGGSEVVDFMNIRPGTLFHALKGVIFGHSKNYWTEQERDKRLIQVEVLAAHRLLRRVLWHRDGTETQVLQKRERKRSELKKHLSRLSISVDHRAGRVRCHSRQQNFSAFAVSWPVSRGLVAVILNDLGWFSE